MKTCFKCGLVKPLNEFYRHPQMGDGHLGKCRECARRDVKENYAKRREQYSEYEHTRNRTENRRQQRAINQLKYKAKWSERRVAHCAVGNAIRDGRLQRQPCRVCGAKAQAHHADYSKPLEVDWLCFKHHRELEHGQVVIAETF